MARRSQRFQHSAVMARICLCDFASNTRACPFASTPRCNRSRWTVFEGEAANSRRYTDTPVRAILLLRHYSLLFVL